MSIKSGKQIKISAIVSYIALFINIVITLLYTPWMVGKIGKANYGLYTLSISLISIFMLDFGLSSAVTKFLSKYRAENNQKKINSLVGAIFKLYFFIDIILIFLLTTVFFFIGKIYKNLSPDELELFKTLYIVVSIFNIISFPMTPLSGILSAYEKFIQLKLCDLFNKVFRVILVVIVLLMNFDVVAIVVANAITGVLTILIKIVIIKVCIPIKIDFKSANIETYKEIFSFSSWLTIISVAQRILHNLVPSILAITAGSIAVALYSPASSLGEYFYLIAVAVNGLFLPTIARMIANNEEEKILELMIKVGRYQTYILGLIIVGFFCVGDLFMITWMGKDFIISYYCALLLMIPSLFEYSQQIANTTIVAKNYVKHQAILLIISSVFGCGLSFLFSYLWGSIGVSLSLCITGLINVIGLNYIHKKKLNIDIKRFYKECYFNIFITLIITATLGRILCLIIPLYGILGIIVKSFIVIIIFSLSSFLFSMNKYEKNIIKSLILNLKKMINKKQHQN